MGNIPTIDGSSSKPRIVVMGVSGCGKDTIGGGRTI
jgi:ABC-type taurine transport system ATPase subunit